MKMLMTVATFNERDEAEILKERLEKAGVEAEVYDESNVQHYWFLAQKPLANVRLRVNKEDGERAKTLLLDWDKADGAMRSAINCPECKSSQIEYPQFTRKFLLPNVFALLCRLGLFEPEFYCEDCQYTWPSKPPVKDPEVDILNWPKK